jgi:hypothetical protein
VQLTFRELTYIATLDEQDFVSRTQSGAIRRQPVGNLA